MQYTVTSIDAIDEWSIYDRDGFVARYPSLEAALAYLPQVLQLGDSIQIAGAPALT